MNRVQGRREDPSPKLQMMNPHTCKTTPRLLSSHTNKAAEKEQYEGNQTQSS